MSEKLIKPYEISVWEDKLVQDGNEYKFIEKKLAVIGSDTMTGLNKVYNPVFHKKANGEKTLSFSLKYKYFDPYLGNEGVINPFVSLLTNERKVKLHYDNEWYEFIVKEHTESSEEYEWTYTCNDAFVLELSKNGYNLTFDNELNNNQGTATELAAKVLEDTDWQLGDSDIFKQLVEEPVYKATLVSTSGIKIINTDDTEETVSSGDLIYLFYTYVKNQNGKYVQFIIRDVNRKYNIDDKNVITDTNFRIETELKYKVINSEAGFYLNDNLIISIEDIETKYQVYRLAYNQLTTYDPVMKRTVDRFVIDGDDREVYRYINYVYTTSNIVVNYITNGDNFNVLEDGTLQGWNPYVDFTGMDNPNEKIDKLELITKPESGQGKMLADISTLSQIEGFLKVKFKAAYDNGKNAVYNSGFENNVSSIQSISQGDEFVFRWRAGQRDPNEPKYLYVLTKDVEVKEDKDYYIRTGSEEPYTYTIVTPIGTEDPSEQGWYESQESEISDVDCLVATPNLRAIVAKYTQDEPSRWAYYYKHIDVDDIVLEFDLAEGQSTPEILNNIIEGGILQDYYSPTTDKKPIEGKTYYRLYNDEYIEVYIPSEEYMDTYYEKHQQYVIDNIVQTPSTKYIYKNSKDNQDYIWNGLSGDFELKNNNNYLPYYYLTAKATKALTNSVLKDPTQKYGIFIYTDDNNSSAKPFYIQDIQLTRLIKDAEERPIIMGNIPIANSTPTEYYYIQPEEGAAAEDVIMYTTLKELKESIGIHTDIVPLYNEDSEKNLTISASKSNCFDILQTIAETFECWVDLYVEHEPDTGYIVYEDGIPQKYVYLREYAGNKQHAGFKYGINLQSIEREVNSTEFVTKLIVDQSQSEYVDEGYVSIASAPSNTSGESYILNFDYYYNQQLLNRQEAEADKLQFITELAEINKEIQTKEAQRRNLEASMTALGSKRNVYTELIDTAKEQKTQGLADFEELTGCTYDEYREQQDSMMKYSGERYVLTNDTTIKKDKTYYEYRRETVEKSVETPGKDKSLGSINFVTLSNPINESEATVTIKARATGIGNLDKTVKVIIDNTERKTIEIPFVLSAGNPILVLEYGSSVYGKQKWIAYWEDPTVFPDVDRLGFYCFTVEYKQAIDGEEYIMEPVNTPNDNPHEAGYYELFADITEEDTIVDLIGQVYVTSATINNYSGILTNIEQEYWAIRRQLRGLETYNVKVWVGIDEHNQYHVYVELNDYLPGFKFTVAGIDYESTVSVKYFDLEFENIEDLVISFIPPSAYQMEEVSYTINPNIVKTILIEPIEEQQGLEAKLKVLYEEKSEIIKDFNNKYSRFIQEGTWNSTDYIDSELYYLDALQVSNTSAQPTISYTINVVEISQLEGFEWYLFDAGDKSYVEDTEFFGWANINTGTEENPNYVLTPAREEVIVSEVEWHLEEPDKNVITVQNYKTRFEDFFQRISATVQTVQYNEATYAKISSIVDSDGTINQDVLLESLNNISGREYSLTSNGSVVVQDDVILVQNLTNPANHVIINSEGIRVSSDGGENYTTVIDGQGINIGAVYTGSLNTNEVIIGNKNYPSFRWDKAGISAYHVDESDVPDEYILTEDTEVIIGKIYYVLVRSGYRPVENPTGNPKEQGWYELVTENFTDLKTFVRFDEYGLYGIKKADKFKAQSLQDILDTAHFAVTWDGFFIRNSYEDGGRVSITSDNDFQVIDGDDNERIKIGSLGVTNGIRRYGINIKNKDGDNTFYTDDSTGDVTITGTINALGGNFSDLVTVGKDNDNLTKPWIEIDGRDYIGEVPNEIAIRSSKYNQDGASYGWMINADGDAVFNNITARGSIKTAVFEYAEIQAVGGVFIFRPSSTIRSARLGDTSLGENANDIIVTVENPVLFKNGQWCKVSNYASGNNEPDVIDPQTQTILQNNGLTHVYQVSRTSGSNNITLLNAAAMISGTDAVINSVDELVGGALIDMGNQNGTANYGIGINSSDNTVDLPARSISLFETVVDNTKEPKVTYRYKDVLGTLPLLPWATHDENPQVAALYEQHLRGTQGLYTDNIYIGDAEQYLAFYTDNNTKKLTIVGADIIFTYDDGAKTGRIDDIIADIEVEGGEGLTIVITSSAGTIFNSEVIQTTLTATVYQSGSEVSDISSLGSLNWYIESTNPVYIGTNDTIVDISKTYYEYNSVNKTYNEVANPIDADIENYYECKNQTTGTQCKIGAIDVANIVVKLEEEE